MDLPVQFGYVEHSFLGASLVKYFFNFLIALITLIAFCLVVIGKFKVYDSDDA